jgi:hypothetical protein
MREPDAPEDPRETLHTGSVDLWEPATFPSGV